MSIISRDKIRVALTSIPAAQSVVFVFATLEYSLLTLLTSPQHLGLLEISISVI